MPRKIRDLIKDLRDAGFVLLPGRGKGDHKRYRHPRLRSAVVGLDGEPGDDAKPYQEKDVREAMKEVHDAGF
ncbi:MAG TPA: type II toxin-antitoxin system HicA family toxin [Thermomicrobiales bacterium]|jgi:predicted RNA binding protein YcfA (HicA-like mRNA interferase family)